MHITEYENFFHQNDQQVHENVLNMTNHQGNNNSNSEITPHTSSECTTKNTAQSPFMCEFPPPAHKTNTVSFVSIYYQAYYFDKGL